MNVSSKMKVRALFLSSALAVIVFAAMPDAWAQQAIADPDVQPMVHQPLHGMAVTTEVSGRRYLYLQNEPGQGVTVLEITNPSAPKLLGFFGEDGKWTTSAPKAKREGDPDAPQNHIEYGGG